LDDGDKGLAPVVRPREPVDPEVDLRGSGHRRTIRRRSAQVLAVVAAGGMLGAVGR
jgi:hypothetical protein